MSRYFEYKNEKSNKFWEVSSSAKAMIVRYGKIGVVGQTLTKEFSSKKEAAVEIEKAITKKLKEGYLEIKTITNTLYKEKELEILSVDSNILLEDILKVKTISSIKVFLNKIWERETVDGEYIFSKGKKKKGIAHNNNSLSGFLEFSSNTEDLSLGEFLRGFKVNEWASYVEQSIDNFEGPGKSIDYEFDDFEEFIEGNSQGCDYEANIEPSTLIFNFTESEEVFTFNGSSGYKFRDTEIQKSELIKIISKVITDDYENVSIDIREDHQSVNIDSIFTDEQVIVLKKLFDQEPSELNDFESEIASSRSAKIFSQEDDDPAIQYIIRVEHGLYKKTKFDHSETIETFNIKQGVKREALTEFKRALEKYIQSGGSITDFNEVFKQH